MYVLAREWGGLHLSYERAVHFVSQFFILQMPVRVYCSLYAGFHPPNVRSICVCICLFWTKHGMEESDVLRADPIEVMRS